MTPRPDRCEGAGLARPLRAARRPARLPLLVAASAIALAMGGAAPADAATRRTTDAEARVRFTLDGRVLTVRVLSGAPRRVRRFLFGRRVQASCGTSLVFTRGVTARRTRLWPRGRRKVRFRFGRDISRRARWCHIEHPRRGDAAFGTFRAR